MAEFSATSTMWDMLAIRIIIFKNNNFAYRRVIVKNLPQNHGKKCLIIIKQSWVFWDEFYFD